MNEGKRATTDDSERDSSKQTAEERASRRFMLPVLTRLFKNKGKSVTYAELQTECKEWGMTRGCQPEIIEKGINWLIEKGFPISRTEDNKFYWDYLTASQLLDETKALEALHADVSSKTRLAKKVVDMLEGIDQNLVQHVFMGTGTTVHAVFREILERRNDEKSIRLDKIYTDNLLIIFEYMHERPNFDLVILNGRLFRDWARIEFDRTRLSNKMPVTLSITSFKGFNKNHGFSSDDPNDKNKKMSLMPHVNCEIVLVPMSRDKFGRLGTDIVAKASHLRKGINYIFVTEKPSQEYPNEHIESLNYLNKKGFTISFEYVIPKVANDKGGIRIEDIPPKRRSQSQNKHSEV